MRLEPPTVATVVLDELGNRVKAGFGHELPVPFHRELRGRFSAGRKLSSGVARYWQTVFIQVPRSIHHRMTCRRGTPYSAMFGSRSEFGPSDPKTEARRPSVVIHSTRPTSRLR